MPALTKTALGTNFNSTTNRPIAEDAKGQSNGVAPLNASKLIEEVYLPTSIARTNDARFSDTRTPTDGSVTTSKIADGSVTASKLGSNSVTTDKITDGSITAAKLANSTITLTKLQNLNPNVVLGRNATSGETIELTLGSAFSISGTTLNVGTTNNTNPTNNAGIAASFALISNASGDVNLATPSGWQIYALKPQNNELTGALNINLPAITNSTGDNNKMITISSMGLKFKNFAVNIKQGNTTIVSMPSQTSSQFISYNGDWIQIA